MGLAPVIDDAVDIGDYCRQVEDHLTRVNGGHLVRVVGPGFDLVREWAMAGVPLSVVRRGVSLKAERHSAGRSKRPLRIEFCAADVRSLFDDWRRAVGLSAIAMVAATGGEATTSDRAAPSLSKHLSRAIDKLSHVTGRFDLPGATRTSLTSVLERLIELRETAHRARGPVRDGVAAELPALDRRMIDAARAGARASDLERWRQEAADELRAYRDRLSADVWERMLAGAMDERMRDEFGLPTIQA